MPTTVISSVNVNGIRSATTKGLANWILAKDHDIICFQELKALEADIPTEIQALDYHQYYHPAEKKGYSGVGIISKIKPESVTYGMGVDWVDREGRILTLDFGSWCVCSVYAPSGTTGDERQEVKYRFLDEFTPFAQSFAARGKHVIFTGDINIAHREIDIHNPVSNKNTSGFLPEEREWFTKFLESGYIDVYRHMNPDVRDVYSWWSFRAGSRGNNKGWRIDYQLASASLAPTFLDAKIETDLVVSDHAPVTCSYDITPNTIT
jgi:exodeoxyribonuclease III